MTFTVQAHTVGNPDFGQDHRRPVAPALRADVATVDDASRAVMAWIETHRLGSGNLAGPAVVLCGNETVATVSYNGRVWPHAAA